MTSTILTVYFITVIVSFFIIVVFAGKHVKNCEDRPWDMTDSACLFGFSIIPLLNLIIAAKCLWAINKMNKGEDIWD